MTAQTDWQWNSLLLPNTLWDHTTEPFWTYYPSEAWANEGAERDGLCAWDCELSRWIKDELSGATDPSDNYTLYQVIAGGTANSGPGATDGRLQITASGRVALHFPTPTPGTEYPIPVFRVTMSVIQEWLYECPQPGGSFAYATYNGGGSTALDVGLNDLQSGFTLNLVGEGTSSADAGCALEGDEGDCDVTWTFTP
ncbi:hypothetical protein FYK55_03720 [Roseiconus nitratireducens]|uniref:Uncharacterized protein n=1 Tax=Roseiconus nitratireducens TaxID=2605748 RepID=A0A5M6DI36_9BACT|nr:hypothetical protein [Roseiconus nitratireducens]KAA5546026.1 hypothetical protein FYK55_03720 [Roseiconus nitratireducens]